MMRHTQAIRRGKEKTSKYARERVGEVKKEKENAGMRERRLDDAREERVRGRRQGSSERERQLVAFSRDDARPARFPPWRREDPPCISVPHYYSMCRSRRRGPSSRIRPRV